MSTSPEVSQQLLVLLGPPGSGKSTLVSTLLEAYPELAHFAVRRQFVEEKRRRTDLWLAAAESQEKREWIPDEVVIEAFTRRLDAQLPGGMLIEGLPASGRQAVMVAKALEMRGRRVDRLIYLDAPDEVCMRRMRGRQVCVTCDGGISQALLSPDHPDTCARCGSALTRRIDDEEVAFAERLRVHRRHIDDILSEFGEDQVVRVSGTTTPAEVAADALGRLAEPVAANG